MADTTTQLLKNLSFALKTVYHPRMLEIVKAELIWYRLLKKKTATMGMEGKTMQISLQDTWVESFRATTEDGQLARPTILSGFIAEIPKRIHTATIQFSDMTDKMTRSARSAYIRTRTALVDATASGFSKKMSEVFTGYGRGVLARVNGAPVITAGVGGTLVVDDELTAASGTTFGLKWIRKHMRLQASANNTAGNYNLERGTDIQVTGITDSTLTVSFKGPAGLLADNDFLFWEGSKGLVSDGLMGIVDDGTVQDTYLNVSRASNDSWKSALTANVGGQNIETVIMRLANKIRTNVGMNQISKGAGWVILTTPGVAQAYFEQISTDRRIHMEAATKGRAPVFPGGTESFWITTPVTGPIQMVTDLDMPVGHLFLVYFSKKTWYLSQVKGPSWYDLGGMFQRVRGTYLVEATYDWPVELVCARPDQAGKATDITEAA